MFRIPVTRSLIAGGAILTTGCNSGMMGPSPAAQLLTVSPRGGAVGVTTVPNITFTFTKPMMAGMERYLALHQGTVSGPVIPMNCIWSEGEKTLTCHPGKPLVPATSYTIHMGGGMRDADGQTMDMERYGMGLGGQWATGEMMGGQTGMVGSGWMHANGSYGMVFGFTTQ